ncbi:MAG: SDR family NAD(P)-dependent oxidoreductase [Elusimicrobia bacterium]|nr:SDR family NAD(P)-dependent oxidoreductase [Elusimicrobiota bacterium]
MTLFVTGAGGFIGSHVVESLLDRGHRVRALVHYNGAGRRGFLDELDSRGRGRLDIVVGDVRDSSQMNALVQGCDKVIHLAALIAIPYSYQAAESYVETNVRGTLNILEACRRNKVRRVIVTSTSEVYGTAQRIPMTELHPLQAQSPYAATKMGADQLALSYHRSHGLPVVVLRPFNTYGPRQSARAVLPTILTQILSERKTISLGNLAPRRDLTFVTDTARAFVAALDRKGLEGEVIHFGQGSAVSVKELAERCFSVLKRKARVTTAGGRVRPRQSEVDLLVCDAAKAREKLGWEPRTSLDEGIRRTAAYIEKHLAAYRPDEYAR